MASSSLSESYEKVVLVLAILIAGALGYFSWSKSGRLQAEFVPPTFPAKKVPAIPGKPKMDMASNSLSNPVQVERETVPGTDRKVDVFVGIPWFVKSDESTVDLGDPSEKAVHPPIPNAWWLTHRINPGYKDSPDQDEDGDGFSNLEEYTGETNPTLASSYPALINKLVVAELIDDKFRLDFSGKAGGTYQLKMNVRVNDVLVRQKMKKYIPAGEGDASVFFATPTGQFRFRLKEVVNEEVPLGGTGAMRKEEFAIVEDLKPNLKAAGRVYKIPYSGRGLDFSDYTVVLCLNAIGEEGKIFKVPENTSFGLPYDEGATDKPFLFRGISEIGDVVIEWKEGGDIKVLNLPVLK
jgi:hypothetical protein